MNKFIVFPAYAVLWLLRPLMPNDHMLKRVHLRAFARGATTQTAVYGLFFWISIINLAVFTLESWLL